MSLEELSRILPPPKKPLQVGTLKQWKAIEQKTGIQFPEDYKDFIFAYGSGGVAGFLGVFNPFAPRWTEELRWRMENWRSTKVPYPDEVPHPIFPDVGGVFPWGADDNGNEYCWLTKGQPASWITLRNHESGAPWDRFKYPMTTLLAKVLSNKLPRFWGGSRDPFTKDELTFVPVDY